MKRVRNLAVLTALFCGAVVGVPWGVEEYTAHILMRGDVNRLQASMRQSLQAYLEDQKHLSPLPFFNSGRGTRNAGGYINGRIAWTHSRGNLIRDLSEARTDRLKVSDEIKARLKKWGTHFPRFHSAIDYTQMDFSWMTDLLNYDYWDIETASPVEWLWLKKPPSEVFLEQEVFPDFSELLTFAKVRLMKGLDEGDVLPALKETRHLAELLYSTENVVGALAAIAVLNAEQIAYHYLAKDIQLHLYNWEPLEPEDIERAKRVVLGSSVLFSILTPPYILHKIFDDPRNHVGICVALAEGINRGMLIRPLMEPKVPLERDYRAEFRDFDVIIAEQRDRCRLKYLTSLWAQNAEPMNWDWVWERQERNWVKLRLLRYLPFIRKALGLRLALPAIPDGFRFYDGQAPTL